MSWLPQGSVFIISVIISNVTFSISPMKLLRTFPPLEALPVIGIAVTLVRDLPPQLYDELVKHPFEVQPS
jgi:cell cycle arrest protein BUB2